MQIVINIPDEQINKSLEESKYIHEDEGEKGSVDIVMLYTNGQLDFVDVSRKTDFYSCKYKVLPKGHGAIKDFDKIEWYGCATDFDCPFRHLDCKDCERAECDRTQVDKIPTIIEADEVES